MLRAQVFNSLLLLAEPLAQWGRDVFRRFQRVAVAILVILSVSPAFVSTTAHADERTVWFTLDRGPLAPSKADKLEMELVTALGQQKSTLMVDVSGGALSERALTNHASGLAKLIDEGISLLLSLKSERAIEKLERAIKLFEARLTPLRNHELLHDAMLAKAEAEMIQKKTQLAKTSLKKLAALKPAQAPTKNTHEPKFVKLWEDAISDLGYQGTIEIETSPGRAYIQVDGRPIGPAPVTTEALHAGRHHLVARWPSTVVTKTVQLSPGQNLYVQLKPSGPAHKIKSDLLAQNMKFVSGPRLQTSFRRICKIADAKGLLTGKIRKSGGKEYIIISRYRQDGSFHAKVAAEIELLNKVVAIIANPKTKGEFELKADGTQGPIPKMAEVTEEQSSAQAAVNQEVTSDTSVTAPPAPSVDNLSTNNLVQPPPVQTTEVSSDSSNGWLVWTLVGLAVVGAGAASAVLFVPDAQETAFTISLP